MPDTDTPTIVRDSRIDQIGFVAELQKQFVDPLKSKVKESMGQKSAERAEGDFFDAALVAGGVVRSADPEQFLRLWERGKITRAQFVSAIKVINDAALDCLGRDALAAISTASPATPQLRVTRRKGVEIKLVDAVKGLAEALS